MKTEVLERCPICESAEFREFNSAEWWRYVTCEDCGVLYLSERLVGSDLYSSYTGGWIKDLRRKLTYPFRKSSTFKNLPQSISRCESIIDDLERHITPPGRLLDVGCNKGYLLATGLCRGWEVYGMEIIPELPMVIKREFGLEENVFIGDIRRNHEYFDDGYFDIVTLIDMIEHFESPVEDLLRLNRIIRDGGYIYIQTPDFGSLLSRLFGPGWCAVNPREHLCLFNRKSISVLFNRTGFELIHLRSGIDPMIGNMVCVARKADRGQE